jgi:phenylacetate-CoA ligase
MHNFNKYLNISYKPKNEILNIQEQLLKKHLNYCSTNSPYYKKLFRDLSVNTAEFTIKDLKKIPFTQKTDFTENNDEFLAVSKNEIVDLVLSSGTTGKPTKIMYTDHDLNRLSYNEQKSFAGCGLTNSDTILLTCTIDRCFIAGLAYFMGVRAIGATAIRNGLNSLESHAELIASTKPSAIIGVPSFLYRLGKHIAENNKKNLTKSINKLICIGEPIRNIDFSLSTLGQNVQKLWNADLYSTYASSETVSTFCECLKQNGGHLHPELAIVEIVDKNGNVLPDNSLGEVVITPLQCTGMPLIRFKTGDISFINSAPCECGRNTLRIGPLQGRKNQMLKIQGTTIYPQAFYSILDGIPEVTGYYIEIEEKNELSDAVKIFISEKNRGSDLKDRVTKELKAKLRITIPVILKSEKIIKNIVFSRESRKPKKIFDKRNSK